MEVSPLVIKDLEAKVPIVQGGMGIGISLHKLAGAVAKEGGIGIISAAQIGFREPDFDKDPIGANLRALKKELMMAREIAPKGVIGFNIMVAMNHYEDYVREACNAGADIIISGAGLPVDLPKYVEGSSTKIAPIVSSEKAARIILKMWDKKYKRTADMVVIEGAKAGGHLGFHFEELEVFDQKVYETEIKKIIALVRTYEKKFGVKIPVVLAGGMTDASDFENALSLGADGIQVGTRFVTTEECDADIRFKEAYVNAKEEDIKIIKSPVGMPGRAIFNKAMERVKELGRLPHGLCHKCIKGCKQAEIPYCITELLIKAATGDTDNALLFCGADTYKIHKIETVKEVIDSFIFKKGCV